MKLFLLLALISVFNVVLFSQASQKNKKPQIVFGNRKYGNKQLRAEILKMIIEPLLKEASEPIQEISIDFCPEDTARKVIGRGCGNQSEREIIIVVNGFPTVNADTAFSIYVRIEVNKDGSFAKDEYKRLIPPKPKTTQ
jgi:hypothetical protein